jgi:hypothetical protein
MSYTIIRTNSYVKNAKQLSDRELSSSFNAALDLLSNKASSEEYSKLWKFEGERTILYWHLLMYTDALAIEKVRRHCDRTSTILPPPHFMSPDIRFGYVELIPKVFGTRYIQTLHSCQYVNTDYDQVICWPKGVYDQEVFAHPVAGRKYPKGLGL